MTTPNQQTVRLSILQAIETYFATGVTATLPADDPFGLQFTTVAIGPLSMADQRKRYSLGIVAGHEREEFLYPFTQCWLTLNMEFRATINAGDDAPGVMIERALGVVKRAMTVDRTWGGLALDTKIIGSEIDLITYADRSALGVCMAEIQYRYGYDDPRKQTASF